jgi:hypothetical protein
MTVQDLSRFCDTGTGQDFRQNRDGRFSLNPEAFLKNTVKSFGKSSGCIPGSCESETMGDFSIEALHCYANKFARDHDTTPQEWQAGYFPGNRLAG